MASSVEALAKEGESYTVDDFCFDFIPNDDCQDDEWLPSWASEYEPCMLSTS